MLTINVFTSNGLATGGLLHPMRTLIRPLRKFRVARYAMALRHLRITISVLHTLVPLFFAFAFPWFSVYLFAVVFMQGTANDIGDVTLDNDHVSHLDSHFGDLPTSSIAIFISTTDGVYWNEVSTALKDLPAAYLAIYVFYLLLVVFSLSNIKTGILVQEAIEMATHDIELVEQTEKARTEERVNSLHTLLHRFDPDRLD